MMTSTRRFATGLLGVLAVFTLRAADQPLITAVYSKTSRDYRRTNLPDGTFKPEYYAIANGEYVSGARRNDSIDKVKFPQIAVLVAEFLAAKNYRFAKKADQADFLLLITWGSTMPYNDVDTPRQLGNLANAMSQSRSAMSNLRSAQSAAGQMQQPGNDVGQAVAQAEAEAYVANDALDNQLLQAQMAESAQNDIDEDNARLLGYTEELDERNNLSRIAGAGAGFDDLLDDVRSERYYVIVTAVDFKKLVHQKKKVVLWSTRVSVDTRDQSFDEALRQMVASAGRLFGENSAGLVRRTHEGTVHLGELKVLEMTPAASEKKEPAKPEPEKK